MQRSVSRFLSIVFFAASVVSVPGFVLAAGSNQVEGVVVQTAEDELVVDLGSSQGLPEDAEVLVYRRLEVIHPVTGETVVDRFPIGKMRLERVGERLSLSTDWSDLDRRPAPGDFVVWPTEPPEPQPPKTPEESVETRPESTDGGARAEAALMATFDATLGKPIPDRIEVWMAFLKANPDTPHAARVAREVVWLRQKLEEERSGRPESKNRPAEEPESPKIRGEIFAPDIVTSGLPLEVVIVTTRPELVDQVRLLVRRDKSPSYETVEMSKSGAFAWRARLTDEKWSRPGRVEYFVEAIRRDGTRQQVGPTRLLSTDVRAPVEDPQQTGGRSRASATFDYVNFNIDDGEDQFLRIESDYRYLVDFGLLSAFSVGVGIFDGRGESVERLAAGAEAREINLAYGFAQAELELHEYFGISGRFLVGNRRTTAGSGLRESFGFQSELRIGEADGTRLNLGASLTEGIGVEAWLDIVIEAIDRVPMTGEVVVTNLPVGADLGVSLNYGVGYEFTDWFSLVARVGWNARTINHHGPSAGLGTILRW